MTIRTKHVKNLRSVKQVLSLGPSLSTDVLVAGGRKGWGMKRFLVAVVAAVALVLPAVPASASDALPVGASPCPYPQKGVIVYHTGPSGTTWVWVCV